MPRTGLSSEDVAAAAGALADEAGHYPQSQQPQITADAVLRFLDTMVHDA